MFEVSSPRVLRHSKKQALIQKKPSKTIGQLMQYRLAGQICENTLENWQCTIERAMKAGRTTAMVAKLEADVHFQYVFPERKLVKSDEDVSPWKFLGAMDNALEWLSQQGLHYHLVFEPVETTSVPRHAWLAAAWFPSSSNGYTEDSLMGFWRTKVLLKTTKGTTTEKHWRKLLYKGLIKTGQTCVTLSALVLNKDFTVSEKAKVRASVHLSCLGRCRDFMTKMPLSDKLLSGRYYYLEEKCAPMVKYVQNQGLDWFLGFKLEERLYIPGESSITKTLEFMQKTGNDISEDIDIDALADYESQQQSERGEGDEEMYGVAVMLQLSQYAYFMVTAKGW